jgi:hypothetical protein
MKLEEQLARLRSVNICLNDGVTIDELLHTYDREEYEKEPFDALMFVLGIEVEREPWGRYFSNVACNLDMECIGDPGSYAAIIEALARLTERVGVITDVEDTVSVGDESGVLKYTVAGQRRILDVEVDNDWADPAVVTQILSDIESQTPDRYFYAVNNGQASIWYLITNQQAQALESFGVQFSSGPDDE